jgi:hypothetical protein
MVPDILFCASMPFSCTLKITHLFFQISFAHVITILVLYLMVVYIIFIFTFLLQILTTDMDYLEECSVGLTLGQRCHLPTFSSKHMLLQTASDLTEDELNVISCRASIPPISLTTICNHHKAQLLLYFSVNQKYCCDPFKGHKNHVKGSLSIITSELAEACSQSIKLIPGKKICPRCRKALCESHRLHPVEHVSNLAAHSEPHHVELCSEDLVEEEHLPSDDDTPFMIKEDSMNNLNKSLEVIGESPLKKMKLSKVQLQKKSINKLQNVTDKVREKLQNALEIQVDWPAVVAQSSSNECRAMERDANALQTLMMDIKAKIEVSRTSDEKVSLLTLVPDHWTRQSIINIFGVSDYLVRQARKLKTEKGILGNRDRNVIGKRLPKSMQTSIVCFYCEDDEFGRMCSGAKDFVTLKDINGHKERHQKRLLLGNLKELYLAWKEQREKANQSTCGFSTFACLRPKWCVLSGSSGTHTVCVCTYHQNVKLQVYALQNKSIDWKALLDISVCSTENMDCMMHTCTACQGSGKENVSNFLVENCPILQENEEMHYSKWVSVDTSSLLTVQETSGEFIESLTNAIYSLGPHHFTAKSQAMFLKNLKVDLKPDEVIMLLDFAENYSFVVQDASQSFHWNNTQATLHPFVLYSVDGCGNLECSSFCIISDSMSHSTAAVHVFQKKVLNNVKQLKPGLELSHIHYFSDGAASQYKNKYVQYMLLSHVN